MADPAETLPALMTEPLLTPKQVQERLQISRTSAYDLIKRLHPHVRIGRCLRLPQSTLRRYIEDGGDACQISTSGPTRRTTGAGGTSLTAGRNGASRRSSERDARQKRLLGWDGSCAIS